MSTAHISPSARANSNMVLKGLLTVIKEARGYDNCGPLVEMLTKRFDDLEKVRINAENAAPLLDTAERNHADAKAEMARAADAVNEGTLDRKESIRRHDDRDFARSVFFVREVELKEAIANASAPLSKIGKWLSDAEKTAAASAIKSIAGECRRNWGNRTDPPPPATFGQAAWEPFFAARELAQYRADHATMTRIRNSGESGTLENLAPVETHERWLERRIASVRARFNMEAA